MTLIDCCQAFDRSTSHSVLLTKATLCLADKSFYILYATCNIPHDIMDSDGFDTPFLEERRLSISSTLTIKEGRGAILFTLFYQRVMNVIFWQIFTVTGPVCTVYHISVCKSTLRLIKKKRKIQSRGKCDS